MKFNKTKSLLKKKEKLDSNPMNDIFHALSVERKQRDNEEESDLEETLPSDLQDIEDKKRERARKALKKSKGDSCC
jgi:hypothetical protein